MALPQQFPAVQLDFSRPGQQLMPTYVIKMLKTLKIPHGTDRSMSGIDTDPTVNLIKHVIDCLGALRDVNKVYRGKGSLAARSIGARAMFGFTAELGNLLLDAITFNPPAEFVDSAVHYTTIANHILNVFPEIAAQVTKDTGKMLIHHVVLKATPIMAIDSLKMVLSAYALGSQAQDLSGALPLHWITHNPTATFDMVTLLISAYPKAALVPDMDGYLPIHWAVNQDHPNMEVVAALLAANVLSASKPCSKGSLPLHWCVNRESPSLPVVEALLQAHPDAVRTFNDDGWLPIHKCVDRSDINIDVLKMLIDVYPQGLHCPNADGQLPVHRALDHANPSLEAVKIMLEAFPGSCQISDDEGYLPLHLALDCAVPSVSVVKVILDAYPAAASRKSRDGLLPLHCVCSSVSPSLELIQALLDLHPEGSEHAAVDVVPLDEDADPDTWQGEWVKKRWTPLSRSIGRKLHAVVTLMKTALEKKRSALNLGGPLKTIEPSNVKGVFMPFGADSKSVDDENYRAPPTDDRSESKDSDGRGRDRDRDRDRERPSSHHHHRDKSRDRDGRHRHHRDRDRDDHSKGRRHRHRDDRRRDSDSDRSRDPVPGSRGGGGRDRHDNNYSGDEKGSPSIVRGADPSGAPPKGLLDSQNKLNNNVQRKQQDVKSGNSIDSHVVVPLRDLDFSDDDEEEDMRLVGRGRALRKVMTGEEMV